MKASTPRQRDIKKALRKIVPMASYADFSAITQAAAARHMRNLLPVNAAYLATVAHIRHQHTDYDQLRDEGYDHDSARHFVAEEINQTLLDWGCEHLLNLNEDDLIGTTEVEKQDDQAANTRRASHHPDGR